MLVWAGYLLLFSLISVWCFLFVFSMVSFQFPFFFGYCFIVHEIKIINKDLRQIFKDSSDQCNNNIYNQNWLDSFFESHLFWLLIQVDFLLGNCLFVLFYGGKLIRGKLQNQWYVCLFVYFISHFVREFSYIYV